MKRIVGLVLLSALGFMLFTIGPASAFKSKITTTVRVSDDIDEIVVYVLCGVHCYKQKTVSIDGQKKVTITVSVKQKGAIGKACAYDTYDDETFKCSKEIRIDQKHEQTKIDLRDA